MNKINLAECSEYFCLHFSQQFINIRQPAECTQTTSKKQKTKLLVVYLMHNPVMCSSRKNPYPPHRWSEIPRGRGVLKVKILEAKYKAKLEFSGGMGGGGAKQKTFFGGSMDIFWN